MRGKGAGNARERLILCLPWDGLVPTKRRERAVGKGRKRRERKESKISCPAVGSTVEVSKKEANMIGIKDPEGWEEHVRCIHIVPNR